MFCDRHGDFTYKKIGKMVISSVKIGKFIRKNVIFCCLNQYRGASFIMAQNARNSKRNG